MRRLIVNGDDFGLTPGVNAGIMDAHLHGILTGASMLANAPATNEAIQLARRNASLGVGCHLALVDGVPLLPRSQVPTLAPDGIFRATWGRFLRSALSGRIRLQEVEHELSAQIERLHGGGLALTHLDGHKHVHAFPPIFEIVARLARRFAIPVVRIPYERPALGLVVRFMGVRRGRRQAVENLALGPWARRNESALARHGVAAAPHFVGRALTGVFTERLFRMTIESVPDGLSELMTHPGYPDAALDQMRTRLRAARGTEVGLLTAPETIETIRRAGIVLVRHDGQIRRESNVA